MKTIFLKEALILAVAAAFAFTANDAFAQIGNGAAPSGQQQKNNGGSSTRRNTGGGIGNGAAPANQIQEEVSAAVQLLQIIGITTIR